MIEFEEVDIQRGGSADDLTVLERQTRLLMRIVNHEFAAIFLSPPRNTFTRATFANYLGPSPVRSFEFPMGFPWNSPEQRARCEVGTALALFSLRVVATAAIVTSPVGSGPVLAVLEHPEDLGEALRGTPASIWQFDQALACEDLPLMRSGALFQCERDAQVASQKPTRVLCNSVCLQRWLAMGRPRFRAGTVHGHASNRIYDGPLPRTCACRRRHQGLARRPGDTNCRTTGTAAWPPGMCNRIAVCLLTDMGVLANLPRDGPGEVAFVAPSRGPPVRKGGRVNGDREVYIGRNPRFGATSFGNPFKEGDPQDCCKRFREHLVARADLGEFLRPLAGKILRCHCSAGAPCHADVLIEVFRDTFGFGKELRKTRPAKEVTPAKDEGEHVMSKLLCYNFEHGAVAEGVDRGSIEDGSARGGEAEDEGERGMDECELCAETPPEEEVLRAAAAASREKATRVASSIKAEDSDVEQGAPPKGAGWSGHGSPMSVGFGERERASILRRRRAV